LSGIWPDQEESIQRSLQEKDVMLREIQHRVNNNLQVVSSLLHLQADKIKDLAALRMFADSQMLASHATEEACFRVSIDAGGAVLGLAEAVPCGLIVNELIFRRTDH
jgi:two-component sensor histidine kinase